MSGAARAALRAGLVQLRAEARHVRGPRTAARWLGWLGRRVRWTLLRGRYRESVAFETPGPTPGAVQAGRPARSAGVRPGARPEPRCGRPARAGRPTVGAVDPRRHNPVGWTANVENRVLALGPPRLLPAGARARRAVAADDADALRHAHHVEDVAAFHAGTAERAGALARLAARGVPVHVLDADPALPEALGAELHDLMAAGVPLGDPDRREAASIRMRRLAHRDHARRPDGWPSVSVLLATRRPERLRHAVANVGRQDYPGLELVLALHGGGFAAVRAPCRAGMTVRVVRVARERPLGVALAAAAALATGELLAKMDDDDGYDAWHILDLVLARVYSGAELVGKGPEIAYLAERDLTVRRGRWRAERFTTDIAGGGLLVGAAELARAGGWRPLPRGIDQALAADVLAAGGSVYRTHGSGFLLVRHGRDHVWAADERRFLADADAVARGWRPDLAGIAEEPWWAE